MGEIKITKLPPAGDLFAWAQNRMTGRSGVAGQRGKDLQAWTRDPANVGRSGQQLSNKQKARQRRKIKKREWCGKQTVVIPGDGDPCPRCGRPMEIRERGSVRDNVSRQPFYYTRWFCCMHADCKTNMVMPERYKIENPVVWGDSWDDGDTSGTPPWE